MIRSNRNGFADDYYEFQQKQQLQQSSSSQSQSRQPQTFEDVMAADRNYHASQKPARDWNRGSSVGGSVGQISSYSAIQQSNQFYRDSTPGTYSQKTMGFRDASTGARRDNNPPVTSSAAIPAEKMEILSNMFQFNMQEIKVLKKRFDKISQKGMMTLQDFKNSLGIMGRDNSLIERIYRLIDYDQRGWADFEDFLRYLSVLLNGSKTDKAILSFRILSNGKDKITFEDINSLVLDVSYLWTNMTQTDCIPTQEYVENIFSIFDYDKDGEVTFEDYFIFYSLETEIFGWFDFLNQSKNNDRVHNLKIMLTIVEINVEKMRLDYEMNMKINKNSLRSLENARGVDSSKRWQNAPKEKASALKSKLSDLQKQLQSTLSMVSNERNSLSTKQQEQNINKKKNGFGGESHFQSVISAIDSQHAFQKHGDDNPEDIPQGDMKVEINFQHEIMKQLKKVLAVSSEVRSVCSEQQRDSKTPSEVDDKQLMSMDSSSTGQYFGTQKIQLFSSPTNNAMNSLSNTMTVSGNTTAMSPVRMQTKRQMTQRAAAEERTKQALIRKATMNFNLESSPVRMQMNRYSADSSPMILSGDYERGGVFENEMSKKLREEKQLMNTSKEVRKNLSIYFGHQNWNLVLNMMIGIRKAIVELYPSAESTKEFTDSHFNEKKLYELSPSRYAGYNPRDICTFKDYAPRIFERIRMFYGISNEEYRRSIGPEALLGNLIMGNLSNLTEKCSSGQSGSFFYYSYDDKYMLKTIKSEEFYFFRKILKAYYIHLNAYRDTLMIRIYGLHKIKVFSSKKKFKNIYFCVMGNLFRWNRDIEVRYDLKGSMYGRSSRQGKNPLVQSFQNTFIEFVKQNISRDKTIALKDKDWIEDERWINLQTADMEFLVQQIKIDSRFFAQNHIIDYSLLIGFSPITQADLEGSPTQRPLNDQVRQYEKFKGGLLSNDGKYILYIGIIDTFTEFTGLKKVENLVKKTFVSKEISCVPPKEYSQRFKDFLLHYIISS